MPRRPDFEPLKYNGRWSISIPPAMTATGKRVRKFFADEKAAAKFGASLRAAHAKGIRGAMIPATLAIQAAEAAKLLEGTGLSLLEVVRAAVDRHKAHAETDDLFRDRYRAALLDGESRWAGSTLAQMEKLERWVPEWLMGTRCSEITRPMMERAINEGGKKARSTIDLRCRYLSAVVNHRERHRKGKEIHIMTLRQIREMFRACESREEVRAVALLLFAGIRPSAEDGEISRLDWSHFTAGEIHVSREVSKVGDRIIPIRPRLARFLRGHPAEGQVIPPNWKKVYQRLRKAAGISNHQDITRHTFASHHLAAFGEEKTKAAMGHTAGSRTLFRHYRKAITEEAGKRFFAVKSWRVQFSVF